MKQKIVFFGTPDHAMKVLEKFSESEDFDLVGVVTNPDRPVGRKKILTASPVKSYAQTQNIPVITPENFRGESAEDHENWLKEKNADFFVVVAYGTILPQNILDIPLKGSFNLHFSLLPKYRGASPVQSAILNDDSENTGISIFKLVLGMDAGEIFVSEKIDISEKNFEESIEVMTAFGAQKFLELCSDFEKFSGEPQDESQATFCGKFSKADGEIFPEKNSADEIMQKFRAFSLWPGIFFFDGNQKRVKILDIEKISGSLAKEISDIKHPAGKFFIFQKTLFLQTVSDILQVNTLQKEGKKTINGKEYL